MKFDDLLTIFRVVVAHPELVTYTSENEVSCMINQTWFGIEICCGGAGATLSLEDGNKIDFDLDGENKEMFDTLFSSAREQSKKYHYTKLLEELDKYESSCSNLADNQSVEANAVHFDELL